MWAEVGTSHGNIVLVVPTDVHVSTVPVGASAQPIVRVSAARPVAAEFRGECGSLVW